MKLPAILATILVAILSSFALNSCASMGASSTEPLLSASGFRVKTPETEVQKQIYNELPAYKVQRGEHQGKVFYAYKDEKQGVAYLGGEDEYQKYQKLATERSIARTQYEAAQMNREMSYRFYGAYPGYRY
ncbi:MAG: hypothetical protein AAGI48_10175 [Verrucomicrobiota bacterium]